MGGLVGGIGQSTIIQCYATGSVTSSAASQSLGESVGGLIGIINTTAKGNLTALSFSTGLLSSVNTVKGGLIGSYYKGGTTYAPTYTDCYFDKESTGCENAEGEHYDGEPLPGITEIATTQEMQSIAFANRLNGDAYNYNQTDPDIKAVGWVYRSEDYPALTTFPPVALMEKDGEDIYNENGYVEVVGVEGETLTFKIIPQEGYQLKGDVKIGEDTLTPESGVYTCEGMDEKGVLVCASFELIPDTPVPSVYHTLTLDVAPAIDLYNLSAGNHSIEEGGHLHLQFLPVDRTATADDILFLVDGVETPFNDFGGGNYFSYILNPVTADHTILVAMREYTVTLPDTEGVTFDIGAGEHAVPYGERFTFSLTLDEGIDPAAVHVYANGLEIQPDPLRSVTLTYTIDKVTGPITVRIDGTENPTGNTRLTDTRIYCANGQLVIETATPQIVRVYSLTGSLVASRQVNGREMIGMQSGVYIIRGKDVIQKVVVY